MIENYTHPLAIPPETGIKFHSFSELFYSSIRNEITEQRLDLIHEFALHMEKPEAFGIFLNSQHYLDTLKLLHLSTRATKYRKFFLLKILPSMLLKKPERMLDAGCGEGRETKLFLKYFQEITAVDIDSNKLKVFKKLNSLTNKFTFINTDILQFQFPNLYYDFILFSHSFYYIPEDQWLSLLKSAYSALKPGGIITIIITANKDKKSIAEFFHGIYFKINNLIEHIYKNFSHSSIECIFSDEIFLSKYLTDMMYICNMHLYDARVQCSQENLINYINSNLVKNNIYTFHAEQIFLSITKPH